MMQRAAIVLTLMLVCGCRRADRAPALTGQEQEYAYVFMETTGITSYVVTRGPAGDASADQTAIQFSRDSDREAVNALYSLDYRLLYPNGHGDGIVVVGVLDSAVHHTPSAMNMADSEPYQSFRLSRWYLRAPFKRWTEEKDSGGTNHAEVSETRLRPEDFDGKVSGDLSRFVRAR